MSRVPVYKPFLGPEETRAATAALELGWLGMGSYVGTFETAIKNLCRADDRHVVAVSTGHAALHLALLLMGVGPGDEVITPSFNNIADIQAIIATGAEPVFVDVDDATLCIDLDDAEKMITPNTKVVIVMDYGCHLCDHDRVAAFAKRHGIRVLHDAAHSLGSSYKGNAIGSFSDVTMLSFDPVKTVTSIDGGALIVRSESDVQALQEMRLVGMKQASKIMYQNERAWNYGVERLGFRYHLANLHAAIGLAQLSKFKIIESTRRDLYAFYQEQLSGLDGLVLPKQDMTEIVPFMFYVRVKHGRRQAFRDFLHEHDVDTGIHWQPAHNFKLCGGYRRTALPVTEMIGNEIVSLPFHSNMDPTDRKAVVTAVKSFFQAVH